MFAVVAALGCLEVKAAPYADKVASAAVGEVALECKEPGGWTFVRELKRGTDGIETLTVTLTSDAEARPPEFSLSFAVPQRNIHHVWHAEDTVTTLPPDWHSARTTDLGHGIPICALLDSNDRNRLAFACTENLRTVSCLAGLREEDCTMRVKLGFFTRPDPPRTNYTVSVRLDARDVFWSDAVRDAAAYLSSCPENRPCAVPEAAFEPLYSTWYNFHHEVTDAAVASECEKAAALGMKTVILDSGWQADSPDRGCEWTGDWQAAPTRFPDMAAHVRKVHTLGMKYMMWYGMPFAGRGTKAWNDFRGKTLYVDEGLKAAVLDPRFPEVRAYLIAAYERALRDWDIDGFKFDFIDLFRVRGTDPAIAENFAGRDCRGVPEAVERLLTDAMTRLKGLKGDLLVEFRQPYVSAAIRRYGNMFRAGDCPGDALLNRVRIANLRLTCGDAAVHSDMLEWRADDTPENAARQILASLFGVIQYSVTLDRLPADHLKMIRLWLAFSQKHRRALLKGWFRPHHPEAAYPIVESGDGEERIVAVYNDESLCDLSAATERRIILVNATGRKGLTVRLPSAAAAELYDVFGQAVGQAPFEPGLSGIDVPVSGFAVLKQ